MRRTRAILGIMVVLVASVVWLNYFQLSEAFGSGPPYYGRTTNMDKWANPVPLLLAVDAVTLAAAALSTTYCLNRIRRARLSDSTNA